jgi:hypothetical protein
MTGTGFGLLGTLVGVVWFGLIALAAVWGARRGS